MTEIHACPTCGNTKLTTFYEVNNIPVHSVLMMATREEAVTYPQGDIRLAVCHHCGFITNTLFDGTAQEYSAPYEGTELFAHL
ncbi:MAG: hypothetical protein R2867_36290 [Caldilineaceae bacterium]